MAYMLRFQAPITTTQPRRIIYDDPIHVPPQRMPFEVHQWKERDANGDPVEAAGKLSELTFCVKCARRI